MKVFAYIRYSSLNQKGNTSVETQRDAIMRFVASTPDLRRASVIEQLDEAKSGTTVANRGALAAIRRDAVRGDAVVVFKYDRLGRNLLESLQTLRGLEDRGVHVFSTSEPNTEVVRNLLLTMAQEFSRQLGERCKRALDARAQAGNAANKPPFGYRIERKVANGPGKFVSVPEQASIVREIFEGRSAGKSLYEVVKSLNDRGVASPRGILWRVGTVRSILHNETYLGRIASGMRRFKKGLGLQGFRPRNEWVICENAHEPIISAKLWSAVRALDCGAHDGRKSDTRKRGQYLWSGFLKCRHCGSNFVRSVSGIAYLGCDGGRKTGQALPCKCRYLLHEDVVTKTVFRVLLDQVYSPSMVANLKEQIQNEIRRLTGDVNTTLAPIEATCKRLTSQIESASRRLVHVSEDMQAAFVDELNKLKAQRDNAQMQLAHAKSLKDAAPDLAQINERVEQHLAALRAAASDLEVSEARAELAQHVDRIEVAKDGEAWLYPKPSGLLAGLVDVHQGNGNIPTRITTLCVRYNLDEYREPRKRRAS